MFGPEIRKCRKAMQPETACRFYKLLFLINVLNYVGISVAKWLKKSLEQGHVCVWTARKDSQSLVLTARKKGPGIPALIGMIFKNPVTR